MECSSQRSCAVLGVGALFDNHILSRIGYRELVAVLGKSTYKVVYDKACNLLHIILFECTENHYVVYTIDKLRSHRLFEGVHLFFSHILVRVAVFAKAEVLGRFDFLCAYVRSHNDYGVFEIDNASL